MSLVAAEEKSSYIFLIPNREKLLILSFSNEISFKNDSISFLSIFDCEIIFRLNIFINPLVAIRNK